MDMHFSTFIYLSKGQSWLSQHGNKIYDVILNSITSFNLQTGNYMKNYRMNYKSTWNTTNILYENY